LLYTTDIMATPDPQPFLPEHVGTLVPAYRFLILGEMHGSKQNAELVRSVLENAVDNGKPIAVAFEWPLDDGEQQTIREYVLNGVVPESLPTFFMDSDGRFTMEHVALLKWMKEYNSTNEQKLDLVTFDRLGQYPDHERMLSQKLIAYAQDHPDTFVVVETGNVHARTSEYNDEGVIVVPMAAHLKKQFQVFSIFLQYTEGTIAVDHQAIDVMQFETQRMGPNGHFDATLTVSRSEAMDRPTSLTELLRSM
jgi:hypothetical protein